MKIAVSSFFLMCSFFALRASASDGLETSVQARLRTAVSSQRSKPGEPVRVSVLAPVVLGDNVVIPIGSLISGQIVEVRQLNERQHRAGILLRFDQVEFPDGRTTTIQGRVSDVDNARETVDEAGWIQGERPVSVRPSKKEGLLLLAAYAHPLTLAALGCMKLLQREAAHLQISYKPGVDMTIRAAIPADIGYIGKLEQPNPDNALVQMVEKLPTRTARFQDLKAGDFTNLLLIGSLQDIQAAFTNAGWTTSVSLGVKSGLRSFYATAEEHPYQKGPMAKFLLHDRKQDVVFQKQNDTFAKRHHIRLWQESFSFNGHPVWIASSTHDVAIAFSLFGFRHVVDPWIDLERQKIIEDLVYTGSATLEGFVERPGVPNISRNAVGDPLRTDGKIAILSVRPGSGQQIARGN
jgi:hypothetical protein